MAKVGIPPEQREAVFATVAAVLHLGNVSFVEGKDSDSSQAAPGAATEHLQAAGEQAAVSAFVVVAGPGSRLRCGLHRIGGSCFASRVQALLSMAVAGGH
jgi:hypothetical protein